MFASSGAVEMLSRQHGFEALIHPVVRLKS